MKNIYLILILGLFGNVNAQTTFGVKTGYNLSNMKWVIPEFDDFKYNSYSYFYIGGLVEHHLSDQFHYKQNCSIPRSAVEIKR